MIRLFDEHGYFAIFNLMDFFIGDVGEEQVTCFVYSGPFSESKASLNFLDFSNGANSFDGICAQRQQSNRQDTGKHNHLR